jgi:hypothetical protein
MAKRAAGRRSKVIPIKGSPKKIKIICNKRGVPLRISIYVPVIAFNIFNLDNRPKAIRTPKGIEKISVRLNICKVISRPLITWGISILK